MICIICYNKKITNNSTPNNCNHEFCYRCLNQWYKIDSDSFGVARCPICRTYFTKIIKKKIYNNNPIPKRITRSQTEKDRAKNS